MLEGAPGRGQGPPPRPVRGVRGGDPGGRRSASRWRRCRTSTTSPNRQSEDVLRPLRGATASASSPGSRWRRASSREPGGRWPTVAAAHGATPGQVALAWLLQRSEVMLPIPGTGSVAHLEENVAAAELRLDAGGGRAAGRRGIGGACLQASGGKVEPMLDLPNGITTCLFDLDGVLTQTAKVHAAAWKEMFDEFLRDGTRATASRSSDSTGRRLRRVRRRQAAPRRRPLLPRVARHRPARWARRATRRTPRRCTALGTRKNDLVLRADPRAGRRAVRGLGALRRGRRATRACAARSSRPARTARTCWSPPASTTSSRSASTAWWPSARACAGKPAPDTFLAGAQALGRRAGRGRGLRGRAGRRRGRPGRATSGWVVGVDRVGPGRRAARARRRRRRPGPRRAARAAMIGQDVFAVEPWSVPERELDLDLLGQTESVFALSNGHIGLRGNLDEGEPHGVPGTYLNGFFESRPLPYAEAGYGYPEDGPDADQRHQRQAHPPARRRRAVRRPLRHPAPATSGCSTCATACCAARSSGSRRPARRCACAPRGWCRSCSARSPRSATRSSRWTARARIVVQSELVANEPVPERDRRPARGRRPARAARRRVPRPPRPARRRSSTARAASGLRMAAAHGPRRRRPDGDGHRRPRASPTSRG